MGLFRPMSPVEVGITWGQARSGRFGRRVRYQAVVTKIGGVSVRGHTRTAAQRPGSSVFPGGSWLIRASTNCGTPGPPSRLYTRVARKHRNSYPHPTVEKAWARDPAIAQVTTTAATTFAAVRSTASAGPGDRFVDAATNWPRYAEHGRRRKSPAPRKPQGSGAIGRRTS